MLLLPILLTMISIHSSIYLGRNVVPVLSLELTTFSVTMKTVAVRVEKEKYFLNYPSLSERGGGGGGGEAT